MTEGIPCRGSCCTHEIYGIVSETGFKRSARIEPQKQTAVGTCADVWLGSMCLAADTHEASTLAFS
jgi:hypothetical protein